MSIVLAIDTSSEYLSLALQVNATTVDYYIQKVGSRHSELIIAEIDKLLTKHSIKPTEITQIAYIEGPGSFTGLRIGLSVALGLSYAANAILVPIPAFMLYVNQICRENKNHLKLGVGIDARLNEIYYALIDVENKTYLEEACILKPTQIQYHEDVVYIGSGFSVYKDHIDSNVLANTIALDSYPNALNMLDIVKLNLIPPVTSHNANLSYLRNKVALTLTEQALNR